MKIATFVKDYRVLSTITSELPKGTSGVVYLDSESFTTLPVNYISRLRDKGYKVRIGSKEEYEKSLKLIASEDLIIIPEGYSLEDLDSTIALKKLAIPSTDSRLKFRSNSLLERESENYELVKGWKVRSVQYDNSSPEINLKESMESMLTNRPKISIFTSTYNTGRKITDVYKSLEYQSESDWEWVIVDDSYDGGRTFEVLEYLALQDPRVKVSTFSTPTRGNIGLAKFRAASLCRSPYIVELDHDDFLRPNALELVLDAFNKYPEVGFVSSACLELDTSNGTDVTYPDGFALGYGVTSQCEYLGKTHYFSEAMPLNPWTIRHIVGVPNHLRAWRADVYKKIGGHNQRLRIADDYELIIRTFLETRHCYIPKVLYVQNFDGENSQDSQRNRNNIQLFVKLIREHYEEDIHNRFIQLGIEDPVYDLLKEVENVWEIPPIHEDKFNCSIRYEDEKLEEKC